MDTQATTATSNAATHPGAARPALQIERGLLTVDNVRQGLKEGFHEAQLRQVTMRCYPNKRPANSLNDQLFSNAALGVELKKLPSTRVAWINVPVGTTVEQVVEILAGHANAGLQEILSDDVILTDEQRQAIAAGLTTVEVIKYGTSGTGGQLIRYGENNTEGKKPTDFVPGPNGGQQFKVITFRLDVTQEDAKDIDRRTPKAVNRPGTTPAYVLPGNQAAQATTDGRFEIAGGKDTPSQARAEIQEPALPNTGVSPITNGEDVRADNRTNDFEATKPVLAEDEF